MAVIDEAITQINDHIVQNGNEEITANVLRPILLKITDAIKDEVLILNDRIDTLEGVINDFSGVKKFSGNAIPLGDIGQTAGDVFVRMFGVAVQGTYIYNGNNWIEII